MEKEKKFDLEDRLVGFAVKISTVVESLPTTISARNISGQLFRSGTAPALNYGEAKSEESSNYFNHKMKIALKELRETNIENLLKFRMKTNPRIPLFN